MGRNFSVVATHEYRLMLIFAMARLHGVAFKKNLASIQLQPQGGLVHTTL